MDVAAMDSALYYSLNSSRLGTAAIINNLHTEQVRPILRLCSKNVQESEWRFEKL